VLESVESSDWCRQNSFIRCSLYVVKHP